MIDLDESNNVVQVVENAEEAPRTAKAKKKWQPKNWLPEYTAIVALSSTGLSNEAAGKQFNYTKEHVSNIVSSEQGKNIKRLISAQILKDQETSIPDRLRALQDSALQNVEAFIARKELVEKSPFQTFDRSLKVLQATNLLDSPETKNAGGTTNIQQNNFVLSDSAAQSLAEGLKLARQVQTIHAHVVPESVEPKKLTGLIAVVDKPSK